jgi:hypothetical protein
VSAQCPPQKARESGLFTLKVSGVGKKCDGTKPVSFFPNVDKKGQETREKAKRL